MKKKSKAFTLTELLVVVVVIGVLSAVVLPKFSKVIETRRTTEAEELMASIRTEQERRCALDKKYITGDISRLNDIVKNPKNYTLELASTGINAKRKDKDYTLEMPSYADGRICCRGEACEGLNKNYPDCNNFTYEPSPESCEGEEVVPPVPPIPPCEVDPTSCECKPNQEKCCPKGTEWTGSACVPPSCFDCTCPEYAAVYAEECNSCNDCSCPEYAEVNPTECNSDEECTNGAVRGEQKCNFCGTQTTEKCINGKWTSSLGECDKQAEECDCCDDGLSESDFLSCLAYKNGYESPEYICARNGGFNPFYDQIGSAKGNIICAMALRLGSSEDALKGIEDSWVSGGFKKYACNKTIPCKSGYKPETSSVSCNGCGWQDVEWSCENGRWKSTPIGECSKTPKECPTTCTMRTTSSWDRGCGVFGLLTECQASCSTMGYKEGQQMPYQGGFTCTYCSASSHNPGRSCFGGESPIRIHKMTCVPD